MRRNAVSGFMGQSHFLSRGFNNHHSPSLLLGERLSLGDFLSLRWATFRRTFAGAAGSFVLGAGENRGLSSASLANRRRVNIPKSTVASADEGCYLPLKCVGFDG